MKKYLKLLPLLLLLCFNVVFAANAETYTHYEWKCIQKDSTNVSKSDTIISGKTYTTSMFYSNTGTNLPANCIGTGSKATYTVTFADAENGSSLTKNSDGSLTAKSPTKTGYTFTGWTSSDSSVKCDNIVSTYKGNLTCTANWTPIKYVLDVNGLLDGTSSGNVNGYGTFDVYVNGTLVANDVNDYYAQLDYGSTYQITDIKALTGRTYNGVSQGSLSGTISGTTNIQLNFTRNTYVVDINTIVNGTRSNTGVAGYTYDVYVNGTKKVTNVTDFCESVYYGDVVKVVQTSNTGSEYDNWLSSNEVTITGTTEIIAYWNYRPYLDLNYYINDSKMWTGQSGFTVDIYENGTKIASGVQDFGGRVAYGATVKVEVNSMPSGYSYTRWESQVYSDTSLEPSFKLVTIPTTTSYVGKYADVDGDDTPDGIIFADLAFSKNGTWGSNSNGTYSYSAVSSLKDYTISENKYNGAFGEAEIISVANGSVGNDRFYIMALEDFTTSSYSMWCWYYSAYSPGISDYATITSVDFGTGKQNTANMITAWNASKYGSQNASDLWGAIQTEANDGWFVPSRAEWAAFAANLEITKSNYKSKGLSNYYWSSSLRTSGGAYRANFYGGYMDSIGIYNVYYVRLAKTF